MPNSLYEWVKLKAKKLKAKPSAVIVACIEEARKAEGSR